MEDFTDSARQVVNIPRTRGHSKGGRKMSDQDREKMAGQNEEGTEDVEAHKLAGKLPAAGDEDGGDDVEAHKLAQKMPNAGDEDGGDDVEAHRLA
jgi:hypothetical protein